jgi:hypothetical protein
VPLPSGAFLMEPMAGTMLGLGGHR